MYGDPEGHFLNICYVTIKTLVISIPEISDRILNLVLNYE